MDKSSIFINSNNNNSSSLKNEQQQPNTAADTSLMQDDHHNITFNKEDEIMKILMGEEDGVRMNKLKMFFDLVVERSLKEFTYARFIECYPELGQQTMKQQQQYLSIVYTNVCSSLIDNIKKDFAEICRERQIAPRLSELEQLLREQPILPNGSRCLPIGLMNHPEEQIFIQVNDLKKIEKERLSKIYQDLLKQNEQVSKQLEEKEKCKKDIVDDLQDKIKVLNSLVDSSIQLDQHASNHHH
ncbi:hypothetical protein DFA_08638 [Cavenderia fasciculata]|uniref:Uncharacterized protein n=1 Tax=Cavenderia fasciculata TaxID=261658 RepID=F4Q3I4_CACFS|nr:uncharacterized protein DFA_08638 [Cavenderia fasciculata]EGG17642.1 hypothetical protein DFA_08638 [Cavenderia fasciculata]|eukprot:XP_004356126.1 hypothetical protein DFA_08638 [Cavenderia fasciculata]